MTSSGGPTNAIMASLSSSVNLVVKVRPVVLFQIADAYERRPMENHRVIGTLVGEIEARYKLLGG